MTDLQPVRGTRDLIGEDQRRFRHVADTARRIAATHGFDEWTTPIFEDTRVAAILKQDGKVTGVRMDDGQEIKSDIVVNCSGMWAREVGLMAGVNVPLHAAEHFYVVTEPMDVPSNLPVMRDMDACAYYKEDAGKLLIGAFEPNAKPWGMNGIRADFCFDELPEDFDHFQPILEDAVRRVPSLERVGIRKFFNGPESFTADQRYVLGPAPQLKNFFVAAGFNSIGIQSGGVQPAHILLQVFGQRDGFAAIGHGEHLLPHQFIEQAALAVIVLAHHRHRGRRGLLRQRAQARQIVRARRRHGQHIARQTLELFYLAVHACLFPCDYRCTGRRSSQ